MASLGIVLTSRLGNQSCLIELDERTLHFTAMAEQDIEPIEVLVRQIGKHTDVNPILGKTLRVLPKPKLFEPVRNLLHGCVPATGSLRPAEFLDYGKLSVDSMCWFAAFSRGSRSILAQKVHEYSRLLLSSASCGDNNFIAALMPGV
jgi:hypothetical protein